MSGVTTAYASGLSYGAQGGLTSMTTGQGVSRTFGYNARLQATSVKAANGSGTLLSLGLTYTGVQNNGNVQSQTIGRPGGFSVTQSYTYDGANRLKTAVEGGGWNQTVMPTQWMPQQSYTPQSTDGVTVPFDGSNHWMVAAAYDGAGNTTAVRTQTMGYDAESRMTGWADSATGAGVSFTYDGDGRRVTKTTPAGTTVYVYDPAGNLAAEYGGAGSAVGGTLYVTQDHLGSTRLVTNAGGVVGCHDYLPFGEEVPANWGRSGAPCYGQSDTAVKFTGQERDGETGLDNFVARHMTGAQGRFLTPDPLGNFVASAGNPQSWNMYSYVRNNPLAYIDPSGMTTCDANGNNCYDSVTVDGGSGGGDLPINCFFYSFLCGGGGGGQPGGGGTGQPNPSVTFTVTTTARAGSSTQTKQTFSQCMAANASNFSLVGGVDKIFGTSFSNTFVGGLLGGNAITGFLYGSAEDNAQTGISNTPEILSRSMGAVTTYGRRTSTIMSLNLAGKGGLPQALGTSGTALRGAIGTAGKVLGLGLSFEERLAVDAAFTGAEVAYCIAVTQ
ncbi:MAG: RHS repeat-associated core domain-containing protein [Acidobacteriota bacterium]|nr:RHS repeat-associated core domain-containing protein [Acidobacteriota bacterium]